MFEDDEGHESFEDTVRSIVRGVTESIERIAQGNLDDLAEAVGVELGRARGLADSAVDWVCARAQGLGEDGAFSGGGSRVAPVEDSPPASSGPHPLDLPTAAQGMALAAVDSGRRTVEPGSDALTTDGQAPGATDAPGLIDELRARDWITADGQITLSGRHALSRWLDAAA